MTEGPCAHLEAELEATKLRLSQSEAGLRAIVEKNADGIVIVDDDGLVRFANPSAHALFDRPGQELVDSHFGFPVVVGERAEIDVLSGPSTMGPQAAPNPAPPSSALRSAHHTIAEMRVVRIAWEGKPACLVSLRDITEKRRAEEELRKKEEQVHAAQRFEAVRRLITEVGYDANNIFMGVSSVGRVALDQVGPGSSAYPLIDEICKATEQGAAQIRRLLSLAERRAAPRVPLDLNTVARSLGPVLRRLAGYGIDLVIDPGPALWRTDGDDRQIEQILVNLVLNARDATPAGGRITVRTRNVTHAPRTEPWLEAAEAQEYVVLEVADTGVGMDEAVKARLFEPLFTTKEDGLGTGLGLATVRAVVEESGGHIELESEPGRGTTFSIYLPRSKHAPRDDAPASLPLRGGQETILIVDEEALSRISLRSALEAHGYRVLDAAGGAEALSVSRAHDGPIHALVMDLRLPWLGGLDLARQIAAERAGIEVLYTTARAGWAAAKERLDAEGATLLEKPFLPEIALKRLRELLDRRDARGGASARSATILLVEDDDTTRGAMRSLLRLRGYVVLAASSAEEALAIFAERGADVDLLLADLSLPASALNGAELARRLEERRPGLRMVFVSGFSRETASERHFAIPEGAALVEKPVDFDALEREVEAALARARS
jgi:PAS domain S-box-containing protein